MQVFSYEDGAVLERAITFTDAPEKRHSFKGSEKLLRGDAWEDFKLIAEKAARKGWSALFLSKLFEVSELTIHVYLSQLGIKLYQE